MLLKVESLFLWEQETESLFIIAPRLYNLDNVDFFMQFGASSLQGYLLSGCPAALALFGNQASEALHEIGVLAAMEIVTLTEVWLTNFNFIFRLLDFEKP